MPCAARTFFGEPCTYPTEDHVHCGVCAMVVFGPNAVCAHHGQADGDTWAAANRLWCAGIHRGQWAPRLSEAERSEAIGILG